jgi:hypothetical protein
MALYGAIYLSASVLLGPRASGSNSRIGFPRLEGDQSKVLRFRNGHEHMGGVELPQNLSYVKIDSVERQRDRAGNFSPGQSGGAPAQDLSLAAGQVDGRRCRLSFFLSGLLLQTEERVMEMAKQPLRRLPGVLRHSQWPAIPDLIEGPPVCAYELVNVCDLARKTFEVLNVLLAHNAR